MIQTISERSETGSIKSKGSFASDFATRLLAASFYTRGLWSPFFAWRRLSSSPFRVNAINWGIDQPRLDRELTSSLLTAWLWTVIQVICFSVFIHWHSALSGAFFVWLVLMQWLVFPYFAAKSTLASQPVQKLETDQECDVVIQPETDGSVPDLGYLLREAIFSVDSTRKRDAWEGAGTDTSNLNAESFYGEIEKAFSGVDGNGIWTRRLTVRSSKEVQPQVRAWKRWLFPNSSITKQDAHAESSRLLVFGAGENTDSLAIVELTTRIISPHVTFRIRLRWLPGFKKNLRKLALVAKEKFWWRGLAVPFVLAALVLAMWVFGGALITSVDLAASKTFSFVGLMRAKVPLSEDMPSISEIPIEYRPLAIFQIILSQGGIAPFVYLFSLVAFTPFLLFFVELLLRGVRFIRGLFYTLTGTFLDVSSKTCLRFERSGSGFEDEESMQSSVAYLQIIEQVLTNRIVDVLQKHGIDTSAIRDELKLFVNEGIYMTGGEFRASSVLVGRRGTLNIKGRRAKNGSRAIMARSAQK